jgi:hypothetical protein
VVQPLIEFLPCYKSAFATISTAMKHFYQTLLLVSAYGYLAAAQGLPTVDLGYEVHQALSLDVGPSYHSNLLPDN